jgi:nucleotide-binding universal stress UspA family protein
VAETRRDFPGLEVVPVFPTDEPVTAIAGVSTEVEADLTVVGSSGRGAIPRMLLGSTAAGLVHANGSPVVVVRGHRNGEPHTRGTVVAGVDGSETTRIVLGLAFEYASIHGFSVQTVHSSPRHRMDARESEFSDRYLSECRSLFPQVPATMEVVDDKPAHALLERSGQASLVVVGSHRHGAVHRTLLGSVSHALLYHAECPVAVVPEPAGASV